MLGRNLLNSAPLNADFANAGGGAIPGALYLDIPSNYEGRLAAIPAQDFPVGMPGAPNMYHFKATGIWRAYDGAAKPGGGTHSERAEARYCPQGQPVLRVDLDGPAACTLTFTLDGYTYVHSDNHETDSGRQTTYSYVRTPFSYDYSLAYDPAADYNYIYLALPDGAFDPDLEVVGRVTITGFVDGDWTVAEPYWAPDPLSTVAPKLKWFESSVAGYREGGGTAAHDSTCAFALCDADENNAGHGNLVETRTVRNFDYLEGAESGFDLTVAYSLAAIAGRLENLSDTWTCAVNTTEYEKAVKDEDDSYLSSMWAFDICAEENPDVQLLHAIDNACNASLRVGKWTLTQGILYAIRPDKVIDGMMHGILYKGNAPAREQKGSSIWRQAQGASDEWRRHCTPASNDAGYYRSISGEVYNAHDPAAVLWEYGTGRLPTAVTSTGRWATREYDYAALAAMSSGVVPSRSAGSRRCWWSPTRTPPRRQSFTRRTG